MVKYMPDDGRGEWTENEIHGAHVEWRRRDSLAGEAGLASEKVVDISVHGGAPQTLADFDDEVPFQSSLEYAVGQMLS